MKYFSLCLMLLAMLLSLVACKGKTQGTSTSSGASSTITEKDIFTYNGTESEYKITESEAEGLFKNQPTTSGVESSDGTQSTVSTESTESTDSAVSSGTASSSSSNESASSKINYDKDGDGWTDGWK